MANPLALLVTLGTGIASAISSYGKKKREADKVRVLSQQLEKQQIDREAYMKKVGDIYNALGERSKTEIRRSFDKRAKQLRQYIQQRRIPEYLTQLRQLPNDEQEAITKLMLNIEAGKLGIESNVSQLAFNQAKQIAGFATELDKLYGGPSEFSQFLSGLAQPLQTQAGLDIGRALIKGFNQKETQNTGDENKTYSPITEAMSKSIDNLVNKLQKGLENLFASSGTAGAIGGFAMGLIGIAGAIFSNLKNKGTTNIDDFESSINSSEAVRGIVAGPTNVAISKVGDSLKDALRTTEVLLERIAIGVEMGGGGGGGAGIVNPTNAVYPLTTSTTT